MPEHRKQYTEAIDHLGEASSHLNAAARLMGWDEAAIGVTEEQGLKYARTYKSYLDRHTRVRAAIVALATLTGIVAFSADREEG